MSSFLDSGLLRSIATGILGFIVYGSWAFYANFQHGLTSGVQAGIVQGTYSFALTLSTTMLMEFLWASFQSIKGQHVLTIAMTSLITFTTAYSINWIFDTPEILLTIFPGFLIGLLYTTFYVVSLERLNNISRVE